MNRKLDQFIKAKEISIKKSRVVSPHLTYTVTHLPTAATIATSRKSSSRNFSMTVSFYNPRFEKATPDHIIRHESNQQKFVAASPDRVMSPKRNPILQNNREQVHEPKPTIRCISSTNTQPTESEEYAFASKAKGEYNYVHNTVNFEPRPQGIRTNLSQMREGAEEEQPQRRARKGVMNSSMKFLNPITQGHPDSVKLVQKRTAPEISEETKKLNDRKVGMSLSLANQLGSPKGKVFWDTNIMLASEPPTTTATSRSQLKKSFNTSMEFPAKRHRRADSMKGVIGYDHSLPYRDQNVTGKCTNVPYSEIVRGDEYY